MWIPGNELRHFETVKRNIVDALSAEYMSFSVPSSTSYPGVYPGGLVEYDVISDSLYAIPRLQNYADETIPYFDNVIQSVELK
jgi:hypothetical protein